MLFLLWPSMASAQEVPGEYLPLLEYSWTLSKADQGSTLATSSPIPRVPEKVLVKNVSANIGGLLGVPLVGEGMVILADSQGVYALNESNGELLWAAEVYLDFERFVEAYALGENVYVATSMAPEENSLLIALDKNNGGVIWKREIGEKVTSNMVVSQGMICFGTLWKEGKVHCFSETGEPLWSTFLERRSIKGLAVGNNMVFASLENSIKLYALNLKNGSFLWAYVHDSDVGSPSYKDGRVFFVDGDGGVIAVQENGSLLWRRDVGAGRDGNAHSLLAIADSGIYVSRVHGTEKGLVILGFDGTEIGGFNVSMGEHPHAPVVAGDVVLLPVVGESYAKLYYLWRGSARLYDVAHLGEEVLPPGVSVAHGGVYAVFSRDRREHVLYWLQDREEPLITHVTRVVDVYENETAEVRATVLDGRSAIYRVVLSYNVNDSGWRYVEMEPEKRYVVEPRGGYGFVEEPFTADIPSQPAGSEVEYLVIAVDNVGNYAYSEKHRYAVKPLPAAPETPTPQREEKGLCGPTAIILLALLPVTFSAPVRRRISGLLFRG